MRVPRPSPSLPSSFLAVQLSSPSLRGALLLLSSEYVPSMNRLSTKVSSGTYGKYSAEWGSGGRGAEAE